MSEALLSAEDFLARLRAGTKEVYEIQLRGLTIPVRILSIDERLDIRNRMIAQNKVENGDATNLATLVQKETLVRATQIGSGGPVIPPRVFSLMSLDEITFVYNEYLKVNEDVNPSLEVLDPGQFTALVEAVKKNALSVKSLSLPQLRALATAFIDIAQQQDFPT